MHAEIKRVKHGGKQKECSTDLIRQVLFYLFGIFCSSIFSLPIFVLITIQGCCQEDINWINIRNQIMLKNQPIQLQLQPTPLIPCPSNEFITNEYKKLNSDDNLRSLEMYNQVDMRDIKSSPFSKYSLFQGPKSKPEE